MHTFSFFEVMMLLCFACSWPVSIVKSLKTKMVIGKSPFFMMIIIVGYVFGILHKIFNNNDIVIYLYLFNLLIVSFDLAVYFTYIKQNRAMLLKKNSSKMAEDIEEMEEEQRFIHEKLFYFSDKKAKHIMTHRSDVEWIDLNLSEDEFLQEMLQCTNSKILVCNKHIDDYVGIIKVKEYLMEKISLKNINLQELIESPLVFPENTDAQDVLNEFKKRQNYFGVVIDEFGSFEGIITLHDIMENIVGEMPEEEEIVEPEVSRLEDNSYLVNGDAPIEVLLEVIEEIEIDFEDIDYATVAGFVLDHLEKIPVEGDTFDYLGYKITIQTIENNRIDKVLIAKIEA
ncbi:MAG: CBS domain-containing protein [Bacteroidales bacterium]|nr:CBS domain-containing protein [Bacteroidales bacterium]